MPVILSTDALLFLLVALAVAFFFHVRRHEHLREPWRQVARSRLGMASAVVLSVYVAIGLLDSLHYHPRLPAVPGDSRVHYSTRILSVFDYLVTPLRKHDEKTYSAPFATRLFTREPVELPDGRTVRRYPRLKYGGAGLSDPARQEAGDIARTVLHSTAMAAGVWLALCAVVILGLARHGRTGFGEMLGLVARGRTEVPWRVILITSGVMVWLICVAAPLSVKYHILGTDKVGEDVFYEALKSIRTGLMIGTLTTLVMLPFAVMLGITAGYFRGWVDDVVQYLYTTLNSIPGVLLIAAAILMLQVYMANHADQFTSLAQRADMRLLFLCMILGITSWTGLCRYLRGEALKLREADYVQAAQGFGVGNMKIIVRHLLPNVMHIVLIQLVLDFSGLVLAEAVLSYINIGVDPSMNSWGNMINGARLELAREPVVWWSLAAAFIFMFGLVLAANLFADAVRDAFDPRLRSPTR